ncbi:MAG: hypothetical protein HY348_12975 [Nitrospira defluvii]|nr:hypothetical protein [Nitrospira defluvii]
MGTQDGTSSSPRYRRRAGFLWIFIWIFDQARVCGKNVLLWLVPFALAPLPTLMLFILSLQRKVKS